MQIFTINNSKVEQFKQFLQDFGLLDQVVNEIEFDFRTNFLFQNLTDNERSWIDLEIEENNLEN